MHVHRYCHNFPLADPTCTLHSKINNLARVCQLNETPDHGDAGTLTVTGMCPSATPEAIRATEKERSTVPAQVSAPTQAATRRQYQQRLYVESWLGCDARTESCANDPESVPSRVRIDESGLFVQSEFLRGRRCAQNAQIVDRERPINRFLSLRHLESGAKGILRPRRTTSEEHSEATVVNFLTVDTEYSPKYDQCGLSSVAKTQAKSR